MDCSFWEKTTGTAAAYLFAQGDRLFERLQAGQASQAFRDVCLEVPALGFIHLRSMYSESLPNSSGSAHSHGAYRSWLKYPFNRSSGKPRRCRRTLTLAVTS